VKWEPKKEYSLTNLKTIIGKREQVVKYGTFAEYAAINAKCCWKINILKEAYKFS
jgi:hypothetical protein